MARSSAFPVIPAKAGISLPLRTPQGTRGIPALAGRTGKGAGLALIFLLAACERDEAATGNRTPASNAAAAQPESDVAAAERLVRERLRNPQGLTFANPLRTASEGIPLVCGEYTAGGATHRYVVVAGEDVFLEPEMQPGEMERAYAEFCREGSGNRPAPTAPQGNKQ